MQAKGNALPVGVMFDTALSRCEHVLGMAVLYQLQTAREARVGSLSVSRPDLRTAAFCDALARFLSGSGSRNATPIGVPLVGTQSPAPNAMAEAVLNSRTPTGELRYLHRITKSNDTADVAALIRNGISAQQPESAVVVVAGPLSNVAAAMELPDLVPLAQQRIRALVMAATTEDLQADLPSARKVFEEWPTPLILVELPELAFPAAQLESRFAWATNHPVLDAYQAFQKMPYDAPLQSAAAVLHSVRQQKELFTLSPKGAIEVMDDGRTRFSAISTGNRSMLRLAQGQRDAAIQAIIDLVSGQPPQAGRGGGRV